MALFIGVILFLEPRQTCFPTSNFSLKSYQQGTFFPMDRYSNFLCLKLSAHHGQESLSYNVSSELTIKASRQIQKLAFFHILYKNVEIANFRVSQISIQSQMCFTILIGLGVLIVLGTKSLKIGPQGKKFPVDNFFI